MLNQQERVVVTAVVAGGLPPEGGRAAAEACRLIATAARHDASLVVFLTPFAPGATATKGKRQLRRAARAARVHVALGCGRSALLIDSMGNVLGERHIGSATAVPFSYGTPFGQLGLCFADEAAQALTSAGETAIFVMVGATTAEMGQRIALTQRATVICQAAGETALFSPVRYARVWPARRTATAAKQLLYAELPAVHPAQL